MKKRILSINFTINGIYQWSKGWDVATREKWAKFWENVKMYYFDVVVKTFGGDKIYRLVSTDGGIFLHPEKGSGILQSCGVTFNGMYFYDEVNDLKRVFDELAEVFGCTYTLEVSEKEVTFDYKEV